MRLTTLPHFLVLSTLLFPLQAQDAELEHARQVNLERAANMPNFVADEIAKQYTSCLGSSKWKYEGTIETEITVRGIQISRQNWRRNGKSNFMPATGFGAALKPLFDPACPTTLEFADREELRGNPALVYRFRSPADGCFGNLYSHWPYNAARTGRVLIDGATGDILQFEEEATGFPKGFGFVQRNQVMTWDSVKIGDAAHWLPVAADFIWRLGSRELYRATIEYKNHRHFEAAATLSFSESPAPLASSPAKPLDGVWRSQGYGYVYLIQGPELHTFEVTATTCVPGFTSARDNIAVPGREATFRTPGGDVYFVRSGGEDGHKLLHEDGAASDIRIDRLERAPKVCDRATADTPLNNFEVFTRTWAENYISFDLKRANWGKVVAENRRKVTSRTTPSQLFDLFAAMIQPFGDAHTSVHAPGLKREFRGIRPGTDRVMKGGANEFRTHGMRSLLAVTERYLTGPLRKFCNGQIEYGPIDQATGYLRILSFSGYSQHGGFAEGLTALESALDEIFADTNLKSLVIDVRINFGGEDPYGLAIASHLATGEYLAYTKQSRANPGSHDKWTPGDPSVVRPGSRPGFRGPVVELTGPLTISAGETFTQALMGRTPHIPRVGENTQGVFSDVLGRRLPNGWRFGLPNEVYRTPKGTVFDGSGIPPDVAVPVFADDDVAAGRDPGIAKALDILRNGN